MSKSRKFRESDYLATDPDNPFGDLVPVDFFEVDEPTGHPDSNRTAAAKAESIRRRTVRRFNRQNRGKY